MLRLFNPLSLIAMVAFTLMVLTTLVHALPGGAANLEERIPTAYFGVCFTDGVCSGGSGGTTNAEGTGNKDVHFSYPCNSFLPAYNGGYVCKNGCGMGKKGGCTALRQAQCVQGGPFTNYCVKG